VADRAEEFRQRLRETFRIEAGDHLQAINVALDRAAATDGAVDVDTLFRAMHTLKGAARSVGFTDIESLCQRSESLLSEMTHGRQAWSVPIGMALRDAADGIAAMLVGTLPAERVGTLATALDTAAAATKVAGKDEPAPAAAPASATPAAAAPTAAAPEHPKEFAVSPSRRPRKEQAAALGGVQGPSIRVELDRLDRLAGLAEDLLIPKLAAATRAGLAREIAEGLTGLRSAAGNNAALQESLHAVEASARQLSRSLAADHTQLRSAVDDLIEETRRVRMMPAASVLEAFPRMVRDICRETGKQASWQVTGAEIEVDRKVLDTLKDGLIHMVRNAVDHGIEAPAERTAAGKPAQGAITLAIGPVDQGRRVAFEISDDGRGLDLDAIAEAAVRSRVVGGNQIEGLSASERIDLAFRAGVSTNPVISSISGNGLGLSIVRERVERIDGHLTVRSAPGVGTIIRIEVPTSIAVYRGLLVRASGAPLLWPLESVERTIAVPRATAEAALAGRRMLDHDGAALPINRLSAVLGLPTSAATDDGELPAVVARADGRRGVFLVDEVIGNCEALIKELMAPLIRLRNISAAGLLGTGEHVLVLRPADLLRSIQTAQGVEVQAAAPRDTRRRQILVVDDSITTRTMERNLFEGAGYAVRVAADGLDAWTLLQTEPVDLVVSDIDMPRMSGFDLTARIRADGRLTDLPIVLVTALEAREDKERGVELGANAYVLKSTFDQTNLLEIVARLL
jgi:two-component system chemotaxis sensor kinase CheA